MKKGDEFGWTTLGGEPHYGTVVDIDSNVIYVNCQYCGREVCCEGRPDDFLPARPSDSTHT